MDDSPLVSVVMPAYKSASFIGETIDGLLAQTYPNWELICIDDGSPDNLGEVVSAYGDPRIHVFRLARNSGICVATNEGFSKARGKYIVMMDNDDVSFPERIATQVAFLEANPEIDGCGSQHITLSPSIAWDKLRALRKTVFSHFVSDGETSASMLFGGLVFNPTVCFRTKLLKTVDVWFDPALSVGFDNDFYDRLVMAGAKFVVLPDALIRYRVLNTSYSHRRQQSVRENSNRRVLGVVRKLVPFPTAEQERLHRLVFREASSLVPDELPKLQEWFDVLLKANKERQFFAEKSLLKILAWHWEGACASACSTNLFLALHERKNFLLLQPYFKSTLAFLYRWQKRFFCRKRTRPKQ